MFRTAGKFILVNLLALITTLVVAWLLFLIFPGSFLHQHTLYYYLTVVFVFLAGDFVFWDLFFLRRIRYLRKKFSGYLANFHLPGDEITALEKIVDALVRQISELRQNTEILLTSARSLTRGAELNRLLKQIVELIQQRFPETSCSVVLLDDDGYLRIKAASGLSQNFVKNMRVRPGEGFVGKSFQDSQMVVIQDAEAEKNPATARLVSEEHLASYIHFPIVCAGRPVGVLNVNARRKNFFSPEIISVLSTLAEYVTIALTAAKYYQQEQVLREQLEREVSTTTRELLEVNRRLVQKVREVKVLADISGAITKQTRLADLLTVASTRLSELFSARDVGFLLYNADGGFLEIQFPFLGRKREEFRQTTLVVSNKLPIISEIILAYPYQLPQDQKRRTYWSNNINSSELGWDFLPSGVVINSLVIVPMRSPNRLIGLLIIANRVFGSFGAEDIQLLQLIADRLGSLIESLQLYQSRQVWQEEIVKKIGEELIVPVMAMKNILSEIDGFSQDKKLSQLQETTNILEKMISELRERNFSGKN